MDTETRLPDDIYSKTLQRLTDHPDSIATKRPSTVDLVTLLGHAETWVVRTIRVAGNDTVLLQRINAAGGERWVLPPEVIAAVGRQQSAIAETLARRAARKAADTRRERGIVPDMSGLRRDRKAKRS